MPLLEDRDLGGDRPTLLPLLGAVAGALPVVGGIVQGIRSIFGGGSAPSAPPPVMGQPLVRSPGMVFRQPLRPGRFAGGGVAISPEQLRGAGAWALRMLKKYGPVLGQAIVDAFQQKQLQGLSEAQAKRQAEVEHVGARGGRRRRMNPTNIKALRRAARRLRSFKRVTRKVNRLIPSRSRAMVAAPRRRRRYRGDILPFEHDGSINEYAAEDYADYVDEMEELGFDPATFQEDED